MWRIVSVFGAILVVVGCSGPSEPIPEPTPEMAMAMGVEEALLVRGRESYMTQCNRCHERVLPGKIDPEYWRGIIPHMAQNADLTEAEETDLLVYLMAAHGTVHGENLQH
jgi:hypothetical protein